MGADDTALAEASTLTAGLLSDAGAAATGMLGSAAGFSGGGVIAEGLGKKAEADASGAGGFAGVGAETAVAVATAAATAGTAGAAAGSAVVVAGALMSSVWTDGSAGLGAISAVATGVSDDFATAGWASAGASPGCGEKCAMTTFATTPTATA